MSSSPSQSRATKVFVSYSRKDADFVDKLQVGLATRGYEPVYDRSTRGHDDPDVRLSAQDEWWAQLKIMIAAADVMIFVVSPDSAASPVCDDEVAHAKSLGRRVIAILRRPIDFNLAPERLRALNVTMNFQGDEPSAWALETLCGEIDRDIAWYRQGALITRLAQQWEDAGRAERFLLRSGAIDDAEAWAARRPQQAPAPGPLLLAYLDASKAKEALDRERLLTVTGRAFVKPALQALDENRIDAALRLASTAVVLGEDPSMSRVPELKPIVRDAVRRKKTVALFHWISPEVMDAKLSPGNTLLAMADALGMVTIFEMATGERLHALSPHSDWATAIAFSPDGSLLASASRDATVCLINVGNGEITRRLSGHDRSVNSIAFDAHGARLLTSSLDRTVRLWDVASGRQLEQLVTCTEHEIPKVKFVDDFPVVELHTHDSVRIRDARRKVFTTLFQQPADLEGGARRGWFHPYKQGETKTAVVLDRDSQRICVIPHDGDDHVPRVYRSGKDRGYVALRGHADQIEAAIFSGDGRRIVTVSADRTAIVWDAATGEEQTRYADFQGVPIWSHFSADGRCVISHALDGKVYVWDPAPDPEIGSLWGHDSLVSSVRYHPAGKLIATTSMDGTARLWDADAHTEQAAVQVGGELWHACFSADGTRLATSGSAGHVALWSVPDLRPLGTFAGHTGQVDCAEFSADARRIVTACADGSARVWSVETGAVLVELSGHQGWVRTARFSPDDKRIVTASGDGSAMLWDAVTGSMLLKLEGHDDAVRSAVFSPDGALILTCSDDRTARIWNAATGEEIKILQGHQSELNSAAFDRAQRYVLTAGCDNARLWHLATGKELMSFPAPAVDARDAVFSPDTSRIAIALGRLDGDNENSLAQQWDITRAPALAGGLAQLLAASLGGGVGHRSRAEAQDLLMQSAPDDLLEALTGSMTDNEQDDIRRRRGILSIPLHPGCYAPGKRRIRLKRG